MAAYFQMGHDTENLVGIDGLEMFRGIVLSPVNRPAAEMREHVAEFQTKGQFDIVLDPQLYLPRNQRGHLPSHSYFPQDIETAEMSSIGWWQKLAKAAAEYAVDLKINAVASPAILPNKWTDDYFARSAEGYATLAAELGDSPVRPLLTLCVHLNELVTAEDGLRIASIVTAQRPRGCYLVVLSDIKPRLEIQAADNLASLMALISVLEGAGCSVLVSHCSSDMLLAKAAGATHCSTGKFFNLRRFTKGRFEDEQDDGGRQIPYWFEHGLMGFLREADIARLRRDGPETAFLSEASKNPFSLQILDQSANSPGKAWLALSWRQYLAWFGTTEGMLSGSDRLEVVSRWLKSAEFHWKELEDKDVLFDEPRNDGSWIRKWRQAVADFRKFGL